MKTFDFMAVFRVQSQHTFVTICLQTRIKKMADTQSTSEVFARLVDDNSQNYRGIENDQISELDHTQANILFNPDVFKRYSFTDEDYPAAVLVLENESEELRLQSVTKLLKMFLNNPSISEAGWLTLHRILDQGFFSEVCGRHGLRLSVIFQRLEESESHDVPYSHLGVSWSFDERSFGRKQVSDQYERGHILQIVGSTEKLEQYLEAIKGIGKSQHILTSEDIDSYKVSYEPDSE